MNQARKWGRRRRSIDCGLFDEMKDFLVQHYYFSIDICFRCFYLTRDSKIQCKVCHSSLQPRTKRTIYNASFASAHSSRFSLPRGVVYIEWIGYRLGGSLKNTNDRHVKLRRSCCSIWGKEFEAGSVGQ